MDDAVLEVVIQHQSELKKYCKCLLPKRKAFEVASDKYETMKLAKQQGIDSPETILPNNQNDLKEIANHLTYPVIIKPRKSSGSRGIRKVNTREELIESFSKIHLDFQSPMIQEFIPLGDRYDVCLIYNRNNEVKASFVQREVRHFPIEMGPSTVQESVEYQELIERSIQLLQPLKWVGIVEVEFMIDPRTNEPKLMEINPRFWNSLDLAVQSGVDFPHLFYKLSLEEQVTNIRDYKVGMKSRWLIPGDVLHFLYNKKRFEMNPPLLSGKKSLVIDDTFSMSDPMPGLVFILACVRFALSFQSLKLFIKR
ncbi:MAG: D-aspartate ligase [Bacillales bacterium]|nr:D-aspartate ligase [Bacillales bacterium]